MKNDVESLLNKHNAQLSEQALKELNDFIDILKEESYEKGCEDEAASNFYGNN